MAHIYISLGTNQGDRQENLVQATLLLEQNGLIVTKKSTVYETEEWRASNSTPAKKNDNYLNQCIELESQLSPYALFEVLRDIEKKMGRDRQSEAQYKNTHNVPYAPRIIDLDILLYDDWFVREAHALKNADGTFEELIIPHPQMHLREFVLKPLAEIAPHALHPVLHKAISELLVQVS